ncbi:MAG: hypothetical protein AAF637_03705, partial [Pseudomonadota bacterium]
QETPAGVLRSPAWSGSGAATSLRGMNLARKLLLAGSLMRSQYLDRSGLERRQRARLPGLIRHAVATVPYYRDLFARSGLTADSIRGVADLQQVPISHRQDLQAAGTEACTSSAFEPHQMETVLSSGSSGTSITISYDPWFNGMRRALFLRALISAGYRFGQRIMLIIHERPNMPPSWLRWNYIPSERPPEYHYEVFQATRPQILYGFLTPLRQLAEVAATNPGRTHRPRAIVSTAEVLDDTTRGFLSETFGAPVFDIYGSTENGPLIWQCSPCGEYHAAEDAAIFEFLPVPGRDACRLVVTNLEQRGMPMIRYDTGDLVRPGSMDRCSCGRTLARIEHIEGRVMDCVRLPCGRSLSPYYVTEELEGVEVDRFQLVQERLDAVTVRLQGDRAGTGAVAAQVHELLGPLLGPEVRINLEPVASVEPLPGRKFRAVECRIGAEARQ